MYRFSITKIIDLSFLSEFVKNSYNFQPFFVDYDVTSLRHDYYNDVFNQSKLEDIKKKIKYANQRCEMTHKNSKIERMKICYILIDPVAFNAAFKWAQIGHLAHYRMVNNTNIVNTMRGKPEILTINLNI